MKTTIAIIIIISSTALIASALTSLAWGIAMHTHPPAFLLAIYLVWLALNLFGGMRK